MQQWGMNPSIFGWLCFLQVGGGPLQPLVVEDVTLKRSTFSILLVSTPLVSPEILAEPGNGRHIGLTLLVYVFTYDDFVANLFVVGGNQPALPGYPPPPPNCQPKATCPWKCLEPSGEKSGRTYASSARPEIGGFWAGHVLRSFHDTNDGF